MSALRGSHTQGSALEDAQRAEAEALRDFWKAVGAGDIEWHERVEAARWREIEAVRRTERVRAEALFAAFNELLDGAEDMRPYVSDYFAEKWGHDEYLSNARAALAAYRESQS